MLTNNSTDVRAHQVIDPALLGRPVHLLPAFAASFAADLASMLAAPGWRRYWGGFTLVQVEFARAPESPALRWLGAGGAHGNAGVAFERALLVGLLEAYSSFYASALKEVIVFILIIPVLLWRSIVHPQVEEGDE